jgi:hypothetical protein
MSSSSESEDEDIKKLAAAVDNSLFDDSFYKDSSEKMQEQQQPKKEVQKSQRYLENSVDNVFHSEVNVNENMKRFISDKMSLIIEKRWEYVDISVPKMTKKRIKDRTRLHSGCDGYIKLDQEIEEILPQVKIPIKRRKVDSSEREISESEKVQQAAIDADKIGEHNGTKVRHQVIAFKQGKDGKCHMIEKSNEYSKERGKNGWSEAKIKNAKHFGIGVKKALK